METTKFIRKPFEVEAVRVTDENMDEVAQWCAGEVLTEEGNRYIKVRVVRTLNERQTMAFAGHWVLYAGTGYKVYTNKAFQNTFDPLTGVAADNANQAAKPQPAITIG